MKQTASVKKWLAAAAIVCVLAIAFFWGGNDYGSKSPSSGTTASTSASDEAPPDEGANEPSQSSGAKQTDSGGEAGGETGKQEAQPNPPVDLEPDGAAEPGYTASADSESNGNQPDSAAPGTSSSGAGAGGSDRSGNKGEAAGGGGSSQASGGKDGSPSPPAAVKPDKSGGQAAGQGTAASEAGGKKETASKPKPTGKQDEYLTDPVPAGKPKPVEWQDVTVDKKKAYTATLSVTCKSILDHMNQFNEDKLEVLPKDGVIYPEQSVAFYEGESVFDVLLREMKKNRIHMEFEMTPIYNSNYIEGINNIYEFDCGELSGWMYEVNGWFPNYGSSRYKLKDGDVIEWVYTCDLGRDIGGDQASAGDGK